MKLLRLDQKKGTEFRNPKDVAGARPVTRKPDSFAVDGPGALYGASKRLDS
jgi:hypothetical protein